MLRIVIEGIEVFDEETEEFDMTETTILDLEHSLLSLSKWESKYQKPFLATGKKSREEVFGYLNAMIVTPNLDPDAHYEWSSENIEKIQEYIDSPQSATTFGQMPERRGRGEVITSELIYYWMVIFNIPFEAEAWHLNRLLSLVRICNIKQQKPKRMSKHELAVRNQELNAKRREELGTKG